MSGSSCACGGKPIIILEAALAGSAMLLCRRCTRASLGLKGLSPNTISKLQEALDSDERKQKVQS